MKTIYETEISNITICKYIDFLINKIFALLPMFEESQLSDSKKNEFYVYQKNLIQKINGSAELIRYNNILVVDILSHLQALFYISEHDDYRRHILKICKLLTLLKSEVEGYGV